MYRFIRSGRVRHPAYMPRARQFAYEVTAHLNKHYGVNMKWGVEAFGQPMIHWHFESDSADKVMQFQSMAMQDGDYLALVEKV